MDDALPLGSRSRLLSIVVASALLITLGHYTLHSQFDALHNILRRLYYLPIVAAAVGFGVRGGLLAAFGCSLAYLPHAFFLDMGHGMHGADHTHHASQAVSLFGVPLAGDPSPAAEKVSELILFHGVGWVTGAVSVRWARALAHSEKLRRSLADALDERERIRMQLVETEKLGALGQLTAGLAHEIRNPLSSIRGSAEVIADDYPAGSPKARMVAIMLKELERLNQVLTQFLEFARPPEPQRAALNVDELIDHVLATTASRREELKIVTETRLDGIVPMAWADADHVRQIMLNLVLNAIDAMPPGGSLHIAARAASIARRAAVAIDVSDTGPGIAANHLPRVFEPYFTTKSTGTGLGLSISHALATANGGVLDVRSEPGHGATFTLTLPAGDGQTTV